jgi:hypothetical protein
MTANEMAYQFEVLLDRVPSIDNPGFTDQEKSIFLSKAQDVLLKKAFKVNEGFEKNTKALEEYKELKRFFSASLPMPNQSGTRENGIFFPLPADLRYELDGEVLVTTDDGCFDNYRVRTKLITENRYSINKNNPYKNPLITGSADDFIWELPYSKDSSGNKQTELIVPSGTTINEFRLWYIKEPVNIVPYTGDGTTTSMVNSEFGEQAHQEIVDIAVRLAIASTTPQEYQIKVAEEKLNN